MYEKRQKVISKIPNFWPLVFEQVPPEIDHYIQPTDSEIIGKSLTSLEVKRFEIDESGENGEPKSLSFRFEFSENDFFTNKVLEKKFWYRRSEKGWAGLVSEPVKINWKKGKDTTHGLVDAAIKLFEARKAAGDMHKSDLKEHKAIMKLLENWNGENTSFFTWFAYVSVVPYITAEESAQATKKAKEAKAEEEIEDVDEDIDNLAEHAEVHEAGDDLANLIAEDVWPSAIKYFSKDDLQDFSHATLLTQSTAQAQEAADMSDFEMEDDEEDMSDDEDGPIDIRSLVQAKDQDGPPTKKQKK